MARNFNPLVKKGFDNEGETGEAENGIPVGGSTGQVLKKTSNADYDAEWATDETGGGGGIASVVAGNNIDVDVTDPDNPIVSVETLTPADVSLGNVDNTSDATKDSATTTLTNKTIVQPTFSLKQSANPTPTGEGEMEWDTDDNRLRIGTGASYKEVVNTDNTQTLTNKTLTTPKINEAVDLTATSTELNILDGATLSTAELNILDGVTSTASELNILDGATLTTTELNYVDGVTSAIQTQLDAKVDESAYDPAHEHAVGMYGSRVGMNKWRMSTRDVKHIICWGDSVTQGGGVDSKTRSMTDGLRQILTNEMNEQVHEGFQPIFWASGATAWRYTTSGGWTNVSGPSASNLSPHGINGSLIRSTNTTLRTITWTRPSHVQVTKFYIHWVDDSTTTSGAYWSYSIDGGSTWTEVATTSPGSPTHNVEEVLLDVAEYNPTDIRIRNANSAGTTYTNSPCFMGIDIRHSDYGWVVHNIGQAGASLSLATASSSCGAVSTDRAGDWATLFDYYEPELVIIEFSNDTTGYVQATFETAIETACSTLDAYADLVAYGFMHQDRLSGGTYLDDVREHTRDKVLEYYGVAIDMDARWTDMTTAKANGFMPAVAFAIHPTELGDKDTASAIGRLLRSYA